MKHYVNLAYQEFCCDSGIYSKENEKNFDKITNQWTSITEEIKGEEAEANLPVYLDNPKWVKTYEVITTSQGIPKKGEFDPTWMIALMWPIFYGLMFADVGHGLLLMGIRTIVQVQGTR